METLTKEQIALWKSRLEQACFGLVGIHDKNQRQGCFINILRFINGGKMPSDKHMQHQGSLVPNMFLQEFMKIHADDPDVMLNEMPEEILDSIMTSGKWYNFICDKYVHTSFVINRERIRGGVAQWDTIKGVLDSISKVGQVEDLPEGAQ